MRGIWITLVPMLAAAALVLWGGERLSRRESETRIPADRTRLLDFSATLREELDRLATLYSEHLDSLAYRGVNSPDQLEKECQELTAVRECQVFTRKDATTKAQGRRSSDPDIKLPEMVMEGGRRPFNPERSVTLPSSLLQQAAKSGWIDADDGRHRVYWQKRSDNRLVAILIDSFDLQQCLQSHLTGWMHSPFAPLQESGETVSLIGPNRHDLANATSFQNRGPAALVIPYRTSLGEWQIQAWDRKQTVLSHDTMTLVVTVGIAGTLVLLGGLLLIQQQRAIRLAEERVSFVNRVSHELGSPLTNILLNLDLANGSIARQPAEASHRLRLVEEEVRRLARLVSNVLTFSRGERKILELNPQAGVPDEVIGGMLAQFQPSLDRRGIQVEWKRDADLRATFDPDALAQIVGNLISNVEKYAASGGWLGLETRAANGRLSVRITDRGPGIPSRQQSRIFEAFERVKQEVNEGSSGTGLGLAIARDLARRMGGDLILIPGVQGAAFECDIPAPPYLMVVNSQTSAA